MVRLVFRPYTQIRRTICHVMTVVLQDRTRMEYTSAAPLDVVSASDIYSLHIVVLSRVRLSYGLASSGRMHYDCITLTLFSARSP
jgi:hypothetical protein